MILRLAANSFHIIPLGSHRHEGLYLDFYGDSQVSGEIVPTYSSLYRVRVGQSTATVDGNTWSIEAPDIRYNYRRWFRITHPKGLPMVVYSDDHYPVVEEGKIPDEPVFRRGVWRIPGLRGKWYNDELEARDIIHYFKFARGYFLDPSHMEPLPALVGNRQNQWGHLLRDD